MPSSNKEPSKGIPTGQQPKPNGKGVIRSSNGPLKSNPIGGDSQANTLVSQAAHHNMTEVVIFSASRNTVGADQRDVSYLKPLDPDGISSQSPTSGELEGGDDEMVLETQLARQ
jgi:hypothetical protein